MNFKPADHDLHSLMRRRDFIRLSGVGIGWVLIGSSVLADSDDTVPIANLSTIELAGKTRPALFGDDFNLLKRAAEAFTDMRAAAGAVGIDLHALSSYRTFEHQRIIWNRKFEKYKSWGMTDRGIIRRVIRYSSIPGTSRHHWGTDLDIYDRAAPLSDNALQPDHFRLGGVFEKLGKWLDSRAGEFGFHLVYTDDPDRTGFGFEPWHLSFGELAVPILDRFLDTPIRNHLIDDSVKGSEHFTVEFLKEYQDEYMLGINRLLLPKRFRTLKTD